MRRVATATPGSWRPFLGLGGGAASPKQGAAGDSTGGANAAVSAAAAGGGSAKARTASGALGGGSLRGRPTQTRGGSCASGGGGGGGGGSTKRVALPSPSAKAHQVLPAEVVTTTARSPKRAHSESRFNVSMRKITMTSMRPDDGGGDGASWRVRCRHFSASLFPLRNPNGIFMIRWNCLMLALVTFSAILIPLSLGFDAAVLTSTAMRATIIATELVFIWDVALGFSVGFIDRTGKMVMDRELCHNHYLHGWFALDAVGSLPVECILSLVANVASDSDTSNVTMLKLLRVAKAFRLVRLLNLRALSDLQELGFLSPSVARLGKLVVSLLLAIHSVACVYWGVANSVDPLFQVLTGAFSVFCLLATHSSTRFPLALGELRRPALPDGVEPAARVPRRAGAG
jgi:hypothetical protein